MADETTITAPVAEKPQISASKSQKGELTQEYVAELRRENQERRNESATLAKNLEETSKKLQETEANTKKALEEVQMLNKQAEQKMVRADVKVFASKHGLRDLDDVKLADLSGVKVDANGDVAGVEEALIALKAKKPYLFEEVTTSRASYAPDPAAPSNFNPEKVKAMSDSEYEAYEAQWLESLSS